MITHQSPGENCRFIFPILDDVDLLLDYNGLLWRVELSRIDTLGDFSDACTGFALDTFDSNGNTFIVITAKDFTLEEHIEIVFESRLQEEFPCAFYDESNKEYDDFSIPIDTQIVSIFVDEYDCMVLSTTDYEEDFEETEPESEPDPYPVPVSPMPKSVDSPTVDSQLIDSLNETIDKLKLDLSNAIDERDGLQRKVDQQILEIDNLLSKVKHDGTKTSNPDDYNDAMKVEIERLKTLISQLIDKDYNGEFIQTADAQINDLTQKIKEQKRLEEEKKASLERLKEELIDAESKKSGIANEITNTMDLLHKAEIVQRESTTELSVFQKRLNDILAELQIDISTLEMYETQDGIDALLLEAKDMKSRIESKLKALISSRQKDTTNRFNNITS